MSRSIDCAAFDALHRTSLDAPLEGEALAQFDAHLRDCPVCVRRLRDYVATEAALAELGSAESAEAPPPLPESLVASILARRHSQAAPQRRRGTA